jgi:hypothetical protein
MPPLDTTLMAAASRMTDRCPSGWRGALATDGDHDPVQRTFARAVGQVARSQFGLHDVEDPTRRADFGQIVRDDVPRLNRRGDTAREAAEDISDIEHGSIGLDFAGPTRVSTPSAISSR